jgi:hypothetical protein
MMKKLLLIASAFALVSSLIVPQSVFAQTPDNESITLSPVRSKYTVDAGATTEGKLTVVNDGKVGYDFIVYSRPYSVSNDGKYEPNFTETPERSDAYGWVRFAKTKYRLEAGATIEVPYTLSVPQRASPGGHYGVLFAETQPAANQDGANSVVRKKRVGSLLYVTVNGQYQTSGSVESTTIPFWQVQPPLSATATVKNSGNVDITDATVFTVKDVFGNVKYKEAKEYSVLPDRSRDITFSWKDASWFGFYNVEVTHSLLDKQSGTSGYVLLLPRFIPFLLIAIGLAGGAYAWFKRKDVRSVKK